MSKIDRKARIREYKETPRPAGVYRVLNTAARRSLIGSSLDLPSTLNRQRFQLEHGSHPDTDLQADWNRLGPEAFEIEELDRLEPRDDPTYDPTEELFTLKEIWVDKLKASGETFYRLTLRST